MGRGKKTQQLDRGCALPRKMGKEAAGPQMVINAAFVSPAYPENVSWGDTK